MLMIQIISNEFMRVFFEMNKFFMQETAFATHEDLCTPSPSDLVQPRSDLLYPHSDIKLFQFLLVGAVILVLLVPLFRSLPQLSLPQLFLVPCEHIFYFEIAFFCKIAPAQKHRPNTSDTKVEY